MNRILALFALALALAGCDHDLTGTEVCDQTTMTLQQYQQCIYRSHH
jgi:hypothetical protein